MEKFTKTFQRQTALYPEHRTHLISILVLPDIKKQIEDNVVGRADQPLDII